MLIILRIVLDLEIGADSIDLVNCDLLAVLYCVSVDCCAAGKGSDHTQVKGTGKLAAYACLCIGASCIGRAGISASCVG